MEHEYWLAGAALVQEDALAFDLEMATGSKPAAGGLGELGFVHDGAKLTTDIKRINGWWCKREALGQRLTSGSRAAKIGA